MIPPALHRRLARWRRRACETIGVSRYSRPALDQLDRKLERHLDRDGGFFVEAGANDGFTQSNTYYFERCRGWRGVLVEGIPALAAECRRNRPAAVVVEAALMASATPGQTVTMHYSGLMSAVENALGSAEATAEHISRGLAVQSLAATYAVEVRARTLTEVLEENCPAQEIDLLSLDVEGMEAGVLRGLDLARFAPRYLCVETRSRDEIQTILSARYRVAEILVDHGSRADLLWQRL
jgi:FkbM family methyltransferase